MRTVRCSGHLGGACPEGGCLPWGCLPRGVFACLGGVCLVGVCLGECLPGGVCLGGIPACTEADTPPPRLRTVKTKMRRHLLTPPGPRGRHPTLPPLLRMVINRFDALAVPKSARGDSPPPRYICSNSKHLRCQINQLETTTQIPRPYPTRRHKISS